MWEPTNFHMFDGNIGETRKHLMAEIGAVAGEIGAERMAELTCTRGGITAAGGTEDCSDGSEGWRASERPSHTQVFPRLRGEVWSGG